MTASMSHESHVRKPRGPLGRASSGRLTVKHGFDHGIFQRSTHVSGLGSAASLKFHFRQSKTSKPLTLSTFPKKSTLETTLMKPTMATSFVKPGRYLTHVSLLFTFLLLCFSPAMANHSAIKPALGMFYTTNAEKGLNLHQYHYQDKNDKWVNRHRIVSICTAAIFRIHKIQKGYDEIYCYILPQKGWIKFDNTVMRFKKELQFCTHGIWKDCEFVRIARRSGRFWITLQRRRGCSRQRTAHFNQLRPRPRPKDQAEPRESVSKEVYQPPDEARAFDEDADKEAIRECVKKAQNEVLDRDVHEAINTGWGRVFRDQDVFDGKKKKKDWDNRGGRAYRGIITTEYTLIDDFKKAFPDDGALMASIKSEDAVGRYKNILLGVGDEKKAAAEKEEKEKKAAAENEDYFISRLADKLTWKTEREVVDEIYKIWNVRDKILEFCKDPNNELPKQYKGTGVEFAMMIIRHVLRAFPIPDAELFLLEHILKKINITDYSDENLPIPEVDSLVQEIRKEGQVATYMRLRTKITESEFLPTLQDGGAEMKAVNVAEKMLLFYKKCRGGCGDLTALDAEIKRLGMGPVLKMLPQLCQEHDKIVKSSVARLGDSRRVEKFIKECLDKKSKKDGDFAYLIQIYQTLRRKATECPREGRPAGSDIFEDMCAHLKKLVGNDV